MAVFQRGDILIPSERINMEKWSVIACDQHTSEPEYWDALDASIGDAPSTLRMILPEAYLPSADPCEYEIINAAMDAYLDSSIFRELKNSYVYLERTLPSGAVRRGIVGCISLAEYDYSAGSSSSIRATEGTVEERLPPRVRIRKGASLELPHVMVFADDDKGLLFSQKLAVLAESSPVLYDFDLNAGGGHIRGYQFSGTAADFVDAGVRALEEEAKKKYQDIPPVVLAIGDGNHSLATAKKCGDTFALVELVSIHDEAITFEPIHRVLFGTDTSEFISRFGSTVYRMEFSSSFAETVTSCEGFCKDYITRHGGSIDYIHNDETALEMASRPGCAAVLLPSLDKAQLFPEVAHNGAFPKKSFSIGHASDKRYYLECRKIK